MFYSRRAANAGRSPPPWLRTYALGASFCQPGRLGAAWQVFRSTDSSSSSSGSSPAPSSSTPSLMRPAANTTDSCPPIPALERWKVSVTARWNSSVPGVRCRPAAARQRSRPRRYRSWPVVPMTKVAMGFGFGCGCLIARACRDVRVRFLVLGAAAAATWHEKRQNHRPPCDSSQMASKNIPAEMRARATMFMEVKLSPRIRWAARETKK